MTYVNIFGLKTFSFLGQRRIYIEWDVNQSLRDAKAT